MFQRALLNFTTSAFSISALTFGVSTFGISTTAFGNSALTGQKIARLQLTAETVAF